MVFESHNSKRTFPVVKVYNTGLKMRYKSTNEKTSGHVRPSVQVNAKRTHFLNCIGIPYFHIVYSIGRRQAPTYTQDVRILTSTKMRWPGEPSQLKFRSLLVGPKNGAQLLFWEYQVRFESETCPEYENIRPITPYPAWLNRSWPYRDNQLLT